MFKSLTTKLAGIGAAAMLALTLTAPVANAFVITKNACSPTPSPYGPAVVVPEITIVGQSLDGACFGPDIAVAVDFWTPDGPTITDNLHASITGLISVPMIWSPFEKEYIQAIEGSLYSPSTSSNLITIDPLGPQ